jgi:hypothetical protein
MFSFAPLYAHIFYSKVKRAYQQNCPRAQNINPQKKCPCVMTSILYNFQSTLILLLQTNLIKESIRMGYNDIGDFFYAHGQLSKATSGLGTIAPLPNI